MLEGTKVVVPNSEQGSTDHRGMEDGHGQPSFTTRLIRNGRQELSCFLLRKGRIQSNAVIRWRTAADGFVRHRRQSILKNAAACLSDRFGEALPRRSGRPDRLQRAVHVSASTA